MASWRLRASVPLACAWHTFVQCSTRNLAGAELNTALFDAVPSAAAVSVTPNAGLPSAAGPAAAAAGLGFPPRGGGGGGGGPLPLLPPGGGGGGGGALPPPAGLGGGGGGGGALPPTQQRHVRHPAASFLDHGGTQRSIKK